MHSSWSSSDQTTQRKKQLQRAKQRRKVTWSLVLSTVYKQDTENGVEKLGYATFRTSPGRNLTQVNVRLGTSTLGKTTVPNSLRRCRSSCRFFSHLQFHHGSARSCVHFAPFEFTFLLLVTRLYDLSTIPSLDLLHAV